MLKALQGSRLSAGGFAGSRLNARLLRKQREMTGRSAVYII